MELIIKHFSDLSTQELFEIYRLRVSVFVVEQQCPYQEVDDIDQMSYHLWLHDENGIAAYARVFQSDPASGSASIGRVIAVKRRCGLGTSIVEAAIKVAKGKFAANMITIEAQTYARGLYEKIGFFQTSEEFLEDGIPHINMQLNVFREN